MDGAGAAHKALPRGALTLLQHSFFNAILLPPSIAFFCSGAPRELGARRWPRLRREVALHDALAQRDALPEGVRAGVPAEGALRAADAARDLRSGEIGGSIVVQNDASDRETVNDLFCLP